MTDTRLRASPGSGARPSFLARAAWRVGDAALSRIRVGAITVELPDGTRRTFGDSASADHAEIRIHDQGHIFEHGGETRYWLIAPWLAVL